MGKSEALHETKKHFPQPFGDHGVEWVHQQLITVVAIDFIAYVKAGVSPSLTTFRKLHRALLNEARHSFASFPTLRRVFSSCDQYDYGNVAKLVEQFKRDKPKREANGGHLPPPFLGFKAGKLDDTVDHDMLCKALGDRHCGLREVVRWFYKTLLTEEFPDFLTGDRELIIDGHYMKEGDLDSIGVTVVPWAPIRVSRGPTGEKRVEFLKHMAHNFGEADLAMFWFLKQLAGPDDVCAILSADTDTTWNALWFLEKLPENARPRIGIRRWPMPNWCVGANPKVDIRRLTAKDAKLDLQAQTTGIPRKGARCGQVWVDVSLLSQQIKDAFPGIAEEERVASYIFVVICGSGLDYYDSITGVPVRHWLKQWFAHYQGFGPLTMRQVNEKTGEKEWVLNKSSFFALAEHACQQAGSRKVEAVAGPFAKPAKKFPGQKDLEFRAGHLRLCMTLQNAVGEQSYEEPPLDQCGYGLKDPQVAPTLHNGNLIRLHGDDAEPMSWSARLQRATLAVPSDRLFSPPKLSEFSSGGRFDVSSSSASASASASASTGASCGAADFAFWV